MQTLSLQHTIWQPLLAVACTALRPIFGTDSYSVERGNGGMDKRFNIRKMGFIGAGSSN